MIGQITNRDLAKASVAYWSDREVSMALALPKLPISHLMIKSDENAVRAPCTAGHTRRPSGVLLHLHNKQGIHRNCP